MAADFYEKWEHMRRTYHELECGREADKTMIAQQNAMIQIRDRNIYLLNQRVLDTEKKIEIVSSENVKLSKQLRTTKEKCADYNRRLSDSKAELKKCVERRKSRAEIDKNMKRDEREKYVKELKAEYDRQLETIKGDFDSAEKKVKDLETQLSSITEQKCVLENEKNTFQNQFDQQNTFLNKLAENNQALEANCEDLKNIKKKEAHDYDMKIENLTKECQQQMKHMQTARDNEIKLLEAKINDWTNKINGYEKYFETSNKIVRELNAKLNAKTDANDAKIKDLESKLRNKSEDCVAIKKEFAKKEIELKANYEKDIESIRKQTNDVLKESAKKVTEFEKLERNVTLINAKNVKHSNTITALQTKLKEMTEAVIQRTKELETTRTLCAEQKKEYVSLLKKYDTEKQNYAKLEKSKESQKKYYVDIVSRIKKKCLAAEYSLNGHQQICNETASQYNEILFDQKRTNFDKLKRILVEAVDLIVKEDKEQTSIAVERVNCEALSHSETITSNANIIADESNKMAVCPDCHREFKEVHNLKRHLSTFHLKQDDYGDAKRMRVDRTVNIDIDVVDIIDD